MDNKKIKVGITHGDINGISYEVILKTLEDSRIAELCTPVVYGSAKIAATYRKALELPEVRLTRIDSPAQATDEKIYIINVVPEDTKVEMGQSSEVAGQAAFAALERAVADLKNGDIDVLVTAPINKHNIHSETFTFPGHTEYLESVLADGDSRAMMIMCNENLRVALVSIHDPLSHVAEKITRETVAERIMTFSKSLTEDFAVHAPRIAVLSLNPHAGDNGVIGSEDAEIIIPAIEDARKKKIICFGPYPADGFFGSGAYRKFDGVLAMYHDQGMTPFKTIEGNEAAVLLAGLPIVYTSTVHGMAYDIVGQGTADETGMRNAVYLAIDVYNNRKMNTELGANPLKHYHVNSNNNESDLNVEQIAGVKNEEN